MGAMEVKEFCPIGLVSGVYEIISKVLAIILRTVLEQIISKPQNVFIRFSLPVNAWIVDCGREFQAFSTSLTWKRRITMRIGNSFFYMLERLWL